MSTEKDDNANEKCEICLRAKHTGNLLNSTIEGVTRKLVIIHTDIHTMWIDVLLNIEWKVI